MNNVLTSNRYTQVDEDDNNEINIQDCDGDEDESIDDRRQTSIFRPGLLRLGMIVLLCCMCNYEFKYLQDGYIGNTNIICH